MTMKRSRKIRKASNYLFKAMLFLLLKTASQAQSVEVQGQLSGWITTNLDKVSESRTGIRYIPQLSFRKSLGNRISLDAELSVNLVGTGQLHHSDAFETDGKIKPYRMWLRFSTSRLEARIGLQKINFGTAALLRPLMWFDRIDPRDPLQLTDGVYGLLLRYYFLDNTNIWLWGLYGNGETKGWEMIPTDDFEEEYGGRVQIPLFKGEIAFSYHHRRPDLRKGLLGQIPLGDRSIREDRYGMDGKWDVGIGLWFEGVLVHQDIYIPQMKYQKLTNLGCDYTFGLGNGLTVLHEYFRLETSEEAFGTGEALSFSALSLSYPLGLLDRITGMVYYDYKNNGWYRFVNFQRTLDRWTFYLIGFWNPRQFQIYQNILEENPFAGKGFQIMVVMNH